MDKKRLTDKPLRYRKNAMWFDSVEEYEHFDRNNQHNPRWICHDKKIHDNGQVEVNL